MDQDKAPCPLPPPLPLPLHVVRNHPPSSDAPADSWRPSLTVFGCVGGVSLDSPRSVASGLPLVYSGPMQSCPWRDTVQMGDRGREGSAGHEPS